MPGLVGRLPDPVYAEVARRPGLGRTAALVCAVAGGLAGLVVGWTGALPAVLLVVPVGYALAVVDLHTRLLPKAVVLPLTGAVVALLLLAGALDRDLDALARAAVGLVGARSALLAAVAGALLRPGLRRRAAGGAARRRAGLPRAGASWSWASGRPSCVFGLPGLGLALVRRDREMLRTAYPFGPAMLVGALLGVLVGAPVLDGLVTG